MVCGRRRALQWGRDQLIAELAELQALRKPAVVLQWGRDQLIAEFGGFELVRPDGCGASMGPRSADRGIVIVDEPVVWNLAASMGPRSADRGIFPTAHCASLGFPSFNGAAIS